MNDFFKLQWLGIEFRSYSEVLLKIISFQHRDFLSINARALSC